MKTAIAVVFLFLSSASLAQTTALALFDKLVGKTWKAEGKWGDGTSFKQEINFEYALDSTLVIAHSKGFIDAAQTTIGARNHGVRQYDKKTGSIHFWEFDVFGGLTKGTVFSEGKNIIYQYTYGNTTVTDMWEYLDDHTYNFKVGNYEKGIWQQIYLSTQFKAIDQK